MAGYTPWRWAGLCMCAVLISAVVPQAEALGAALSLSCYGQGLIRQPGQGTAAYTPQTPYRGYVEVRLFGADDRIQLPPGFRPDLHDNGWYKVKNLDVDDGDISGNAIISFIDKPFFWIDKLRTRIEVSGLNGSFSGECRKAER